MHNVIQFALYTVIEHRTSVAINVHSTNNYRFESKKFIEDFSMAYIGLINESDKL